MTLFTEGRLQAYIKSLYHSDVGRGHGDLPKWQFQAETQPRDRHISESPSKGVHAGGHQGRADY